ncbi:hypothetical protein Tco_0841540 [Tanacetum coccineum]|uniref:Uncharacterized protein n=1 Tax=Tanacetum coccineum TaxID=301880 RepID=A0ABQ5B045_9ASTR
MVRTINAPTQATRNEFEELYASANEELYPGCDYVTRLDFMAKFIYFKAKGRLTDSIFNEMLEFFQNVFPISKGFKLTTVILCNKEGHSNIGLGYESNTCCVNTIAAYVRGDNNKEFGFLSGWLLMVSNRMANLSPGLQHVAGDIDNIQSASVVMYEREFFYADVVNSWP